MIQKELFRRQFIFTKDKHPQLDNWQQNSINNYILYTHPELSINQYSQNEKRLIIVGDLFDYRYPHYSNKEILHDVFTECISLDATLKAFDKYCGTFIVIYLDNTAKEFIIFNDNAGIQQIFLHYHKDEVVLASQPKLISTFYQPELDNSKKAIDFFSSAEFENKRTYIGDLTEFIDVKYLKANHYFNVMSKSVHRFFPYKKIETVDVNIVAKKAAEIIKGYLKAMSLRKPLLLAVSAGWESRVLLAASKDISERCHYYVFKNSNGPDNSADVGVPEKLLARLGLKLDIINRDFEIDERHKPLTDTSLSYPRAANLNYMFKYWSKFPDHISITGNVSEVARTEFDNIKNVDEFKIALFEKYPSQRYAIDYYKKWIAENAQAFDNSNFELLDMLYWEENSSNWTAKGATETKMVLECQLPFNSRELLTTLLGADSKYRKKQHCILYKKIVQILYPECLEVPVNPHNKKILIALAQKFGLYGLYRNLYTNYKVARTKARLKR